MIYLDTHVVAWLYTGDLGLFPAGVRRWLEEEELLISPMVELELQYLHEVGRTKVPGAEVVAALAAEIGLSRCDLPFEQVIAEAVRTELDPRSLRPHHRRSGCASSPAAAHQG